MNTLFRAVKASETKPPREDKIINAIYEGIPRSVRCFKNNTALWCAEIDDWIYDWQFPELEYFVPIEETEATAGMRERVKELEEELKTFRYHEKLTNIFIGKNSDK
jgi:hypothetical protein